MAAVLLQPCINLPPKPNPNPIPPKRTTNVPPSRPGTVSFPSRKQAQHQPGTWDTFLTILNKPVDSTSYASVLESCEHPDRGKQIHAHALKNGFQGHEFVETKLLQMYGKCGFLEDALELFGKMPNRNLYSWAAIISAHLDNGFVDEAFLLFQELLFEDAALEFFVFPLALRICIALSSLELGKQLHGTVIKQQHVLNVYVSNALIDMYGKCGSLDDAKKVLVKMPVRDRVSWNSIVTACIANGLVYEALDYMDQMSSLDNLVPNVVSWSAVIGGFSQNCHDREALQLLARMVDEGFELNARTLASVLPSCAKLQELNLGKEIHGYVTRHGFMSSSYVVNGLVDVYRRCSDMVSAHKMFLNYSLQNEVSYNTMIVGYCENSEAAKAKELFDQMELVGVKRDKISWNSMISGYVDNFLFEEALAMYADMLVEDEVEPDSFTLGSILTACADTAALRQGKEIHAHAIVRGLQSSPFIGGALVEMYCKCQDLASAVFAFNMVEERDIATWNALVSGYSHLSGIEDIHGLLERMKEDGFEPNAYTWNSIVAGYAENGHYDLVMSLFSDMQKNNVRPDIYTIGMVLTACSKLATLERGKQLHAYAIRHGYDSDVHIGAALVDMYAKCGSIKNAHLAYDRICNYNLVSQNAVLTAYAMHGLGEEGIELFRRMLTDSYRPDHVTFLSVLSSCVHAGAVETGREFFNLMPHFHVAPSLKHYTCMVDLLSRAGQLTEAFELVKKMPMEPDAVLWSALLGGCVIYNNIELGELAAERLIELETDNTGNFVLLANLYASAGRWSNLARTRQMIKDRGMQKSPGCSWIEAKNGIHVFLAQDKSHERTDEIYFILDTLTVQMQRDMEHRIAVY